MHEINKPAIVIPNPVREIMNTLEQNGYEAYVVGGCVRDAMIGTEPKDWDITTSALPEQVKSLFSNTVDTGIQHGTVMVIKKGVGYEVTTYRIDGEYRDGRHPQTVTFTRSLAEDLKRRDFTINALAYNPKTGVTDLHGGMEDLNRHLIRCVGDADARFSEDALRIMRAVRFSAQLAFEIEPDTLSAITRHAARLSKVSMERIRVEFEKTLTSCQPQRVYQYDELGISPFILPKRKAAETCFRQDEPIFFTELKGTDEEIRILRLAAFFRPLNEAEAKASLRALKYDNKTIQLVSGIIRYKDREIPPDKTAVKQAMHEMGSELFSYLISFREAKTGVSYKEVREIRDRITEDREPFELSHLEISGYDLISEGIPEGARVGETLNELLRRVICDPALNQKETLLELARNFAANEK